MKRKGRKSHNKKPLPKKAFTRAETNYYAALSEWNDFDEDEPAKTAGSQIEKEIAMVGAGVGGEFTNTQELYVVKYIEAMQTTEKK